MTDTIKHAAGTITAAGGFFGAVTLQRINEYGSTACWMIGCIAGLCTVHSWWEKRKRRKNKKDL